MFWLSSCPPQISEKRLLFLLEWYSLNLECLICNLNESHFVKHLSLSCSPKMFSVSCNKGNLRSLFNCFRWFIRAVDTILSNLVSLLFCASIASIDFGWFLATFCITLVFTGDDNVFIMFSKLICLRFICLSCFQYCFHSNTVLIESGTVVVLECSFDTGLLASDEFRFKSDLIWVESGVRRSEVETLKTDKSTCLLRIVCGCLRLQYLMGLLNHH